MSLEKNLLDAIQILSQSDIEKAGYDKTISATIVECIDATIGKYKIKYQDSYFYAYYDNTNVVFKEGDTVQILIPQGDFTSSTNRIIGGTPSNNLRTATRYNGNTDLRMRYEKIGPNCATYQPQYSKYISNEGVFSLYAMSSPYKIPFWDGSYYVVSLTSYNDHTAFGGRGNEVNAIICEFDIQTDLGPLQKNKGNYGIHLSMSTPIGTKHYEIDTNNLIGNPYNFNSLTHQYAIFDFDGYTGQETQLDGYFFSDGFYTDDNNHGFIKISNFEIYAARKLTEEEFNDGKLFINADKMAFNGEGDNVNLNAELRIKGNLVNSNSQDVKYYWFVQNPGILKTSKLFNAYGGEGWMCLNEHYKILSDYKAAAITEINIDENYSSWTIPRTLTREHIPRAIKSSDWYFLANLIDQNSYLRYCNEIYYYDYDNDYVTKEGEYSWNFVSMSPTDMKRNVIIDSKTNEYYQVKDLDIIDVTFVFLDGVRETVPYIYSQGEKVSWTIGGREFYRWEDSWTLYSREDELSSSSINNGDIIEWIPSVDYLRVDETNACSENNTFKCVAVYEDKTYEATIEIKNFYGEYISISIIDDDEYEITSYTPEIVYNGRGTINLKCNFYGEDPNYKYIWSKIDIFGDSYLIEENPLNLDSYKSGSNIIKDYEDQIKRNVAPKSILEEKMSYVSGLTTPMTELIDNNILWRINVNSIIGSTIYCCSVYTLDQNDLGAYIGSASIKITNKANEANKYTLTIKNGNKVFHYDIKGVSPLHKSKIDNKKITYIEPLDVLLYDENRNLINKSSLDFIQWRMPKNNTFLIPDSTYNYSSHNYEIKEEEDFIVYKTDGSNSEGFYYDIIQMYNSKYKNNNDIELVVSYRGNLYSAITNFSFLKDGDDGSNGTKYTCRIVPNIENAASIDYSVNFFYTVLTFSGNNYSALIYSEGNNYDFKNLSGGANPFKIEIWNGNERVWIGNQTDVPKSVRVSWKILKSGNDNNYGSFYNIDSNTGTLSIIGGETVRNRLIEVLEEGENVLQYHPSNLVQAKVTYQGFDCYVTVPIVTIYNYNSNYETILKSNTGFLYSVYNSEGRYPEYAISNGDSNAASRFDLKVTYRQKDISDFDPIYIEHVSEPDLDKYGQYMFSYNWFILGASDSTWDNGTVKSLICTDVDDPENGICPTSKRHFKPVQNFDGNRLNVGVKCVIQDSSGDIVSAIHIPIYMYLNRYGNSAINGWDGNSVVLGENNENIILAPQVGAGIKEQDNSFTGVLMGTQLTQSSGSKEVGLHGYYKGQRSIFLDASSGKAEFGLTNQGKIIIDPRNGQAIIKSGNYVDSLSNGSGMQIDFSTPEIRFGNRHFIVDSNGNLTANNVNLTGIINAQGGQIGEWTIISNSSDSDYGQLVSQNRNIHLDGGHSGRIYSGNKNSHDSTNSGFFLNSDGLTIGSSSNSAIKLRASGDSQIGGWLLRSGKFTNAAGTIYIGTDGWKFGNNFEIDSSGNVNISGNLNVQGGSNLGGWSVNDNSLYSGNLILNGTTGTITGPGYSLDRTNGLTVTGGRIGNFNINNSGFDFTEVKNIPDSGGKIATYLSKIDPTTIFVQSYIKAPGDTSEYGENSANLFMEIEDNSAGHPAAGHFRLKADTIKIGCSTTSPIANLDDIETQPFVLTGYISGAQKVISFPTLAKACGKHEFEGGDLVFYGRIDGVTRQISFRDLVNACFG